MVVSPTVRKLVTICCRLCRAPSKNIIRIEGMFVRINVWGSVVSAKPQGTRRGVYM